MQSIEVVRRQLAGIPHVVEHDAVNLKILEAGSLGFWHRGWIQWS
jgi:hypothetical protein